MTHYRSNGPRFVDESVDGETLIMDMVTGTYYTCVGPATVAWHALKNGAEPGQVVSLVASAYEVSCADVERDIGPFLADLLECQILVAADGVADGMPNAPTSGPDDGARTPVLSGPYEPMRLERYTDLADLILLDPVHDVSGAVWPPA